ncbi:MAG TPA: MFS transporter, partial [Solirubrobacterales bacterium]|nr:MFS transporter [Solirubrobacterales bacterium]
MSAAVRRSFASLEIRNYRLYFGGQVVSLAGNWMQIVAELWLVLLLTGSGVAVGLATALQFSGILLFGAIGGALADRFDKRKLLMISQTGMAVPATVLFALTALGAVESWMVFAVIALRGLVLAVDNPARQAFVIEIVGPDRVVNAVSLNSVLVHSARIVGPAIAGVIIALWGVAPCFGLNALSFAAMLVALVKMNPARIQRPHPDRERGNIRQALRHIAGRAELRVPLLLMLVLSTIGFNFQVVIPLLADQSFDGNVSAYSMLMVAMGVGSITGALTVGTRKKVSRELITAAAVGFGVTSLLAAAAPTLPLEMLALGLLGVCSVTFAA